MNPDQYGKAALDAGLAVGAVSSPWWLTAIQTGSTAIVAVGGVAVVVMRFLIVYREWRQGRGR